MSFKRVGWIDIARAIGIFLVIYGHFLDRDSYRYLIYSFHIPLFFFLSGIIFRYKTHENFFFFLRKNIKAILFPYFLFAFLQLLFWILFTKPPETTSVEISKQFFGIFYGSGSNGLLAFDSVLWFLPCLFVTKVGFALIARLVKNCYVLGSILFLFSLVGYAFSIMYPQIKLPFQTESTLSSIVFFGVGYLWSHFEKPTILLEKYGKNVFLLFVIFCIFFATINFNLSGRQVDMRLNHLNNYFLFYLGSFSGILASLSLSVLLKKNIVLEYIGKYSLLLFAWHPLLIPYFPQTFSPIISTFIGDFSKSIFPFFYTIITISILLFIFLVLKKIKIISLRRLN